MALILARTWVQSKGPTSSEETAVRREVLVHLPAERSALVVIDAWASHPNAGWAARMSCNVPTLKELVEGFRAAGRPIFHDPSGMPIHGAIVDGWGAGDHLIPWDPDGGGTDVLDALLRELGIAAIFWAGYSANLCLMSKPCGFRAILPRDWTRRHFLVRDATIAFESNETLAGERLLDAACHEVEYYPMGFSCRTRDAVAAVRSPSAGADRHGSLH